MDCPLTEMKRMRSESESTFQCREERVEASVVAGAKIVCLVRTRPGGHREANRSGW